MARPIKYTVDDLKYSINKYFAECDMNEDPYTVTGLALFLGINKSTFNSWENAEREFKDMDSNEIAEFCNSIKLAKLKIENYAEKCLFTAKNPAGVIFNLKNNWNWVDKHEVTSNTNITNKNVLEGLSADEIKQILGETEQNGKLIED